MSARNVPQSPAAAVPREVLDAARERGWKFFPVEARGKKPLIKGWQQAATNDAAQLAAWRASFDGCNFGWPIPQGHFVLDADGMEGKLALAALEAVNGPLPKTLTIKTGNGTHRVFGCDAPVRNSASRVAPKVDVRGSGGYIVFAGSVHPNGKRYTIEDAAPVAPAPEWLIAKATQETQAAADGAIPEGTRNGTLASLAGAMRRKGATLEAILGALRAQNQQCSPPLPEKELQTIARSVARYAPAEATVDATADDEPIIENVEDVQEEDVVWLWRHRLPLKMLAGIEGNPGDGKTFIALSIAAEGSKGREPYTEKKCEPFTTLYLSTENVTSLTTKKRFRAMGGDCKRLRVLKGAKGKDGEERGITLASVPVIEKAVLKTRARLLVIDPLQSFMDAKTDMHRANETRPLLDGLAKLAERRNICIVIVRHLSKNSGGRSGLRGLGSVDITGAMRSVLMVGTAPDDPANRALVHIKSNIGPLAESLRFAIEGKDSNAKLVWKGTSQLTSTDLAAPDTSKRKSKVDLAENYLWDALEHGPRPVSELVKEGSFDLRTLQRAALKARIVRSGRDGERGGWIWELPKFATKGGARASP